MDILEAKVRNEVAELINKIESIDADANFPLQGCPFKKVKFLRMKHNMLAKKKGSPSHVWMGLYTKKERAIINKI